MSHKPDGSVKVAKLNHAPRHKSVTTDEADTPGDVAKKLEAAFGAEYVEILSIALKRSAKAMRMRRK